LATAVAVQVAAAVVAAGIASPATYYVSPTGNDANPGTEAQPWATFNRAWGTIARGDTLILLDGVYYQTLSPQLPQPDGRYVTIRAKNDGQAIIDGQGVRTPVEFADYKESSYVILDGIVARNGDLAVYYIRNHHVILRRCSGQNASLDENSAVFLVWATDVLIEDCVSSGTGRKQFLLFQSDRVTVRRSFAMPLRWDGRRFCAVWWPYTSSFEFYQTSNSIFENNIGYARADAYHFYVKTDGPLVENNRFLGNMALLAAKEPDGTLHPHPGPRPSGGDNCTWVQDWDAQRDVRTGFSIYPGGPLNNHVFQDNLAYGNATLALAFAGCCSTFTNGTLRRMTAMGNGADNPPSAGGASIRADILQEDLNRFSVVSDNKIDRVYDFNRVTSLTGGGARLRHRYVS